MSDTSRNRKHKSLANPRSPSTSLTRLILTVVHLACLVVYLVPILTHGYRGLPVLDESHIASEENKDVLGTSSLKEVFTNDYWGRNMNMESSHKSWRPLTILSFRWLKGGGLGMGITALTAHRIVNVFAHAATGECVSIIAVRLFSHLTEPQALLLRCLVKLFFCLHPTHVEVTANAANRPHLFAVLASVVLCDPHLDILYVILMQVIGLLCSETFIFQMPAVVITLTLIQWRVTCRCQNQPPTLSIFISSLVTLLPRHFILFVLSIAYLIFRYIMDWLSIPEGLIRPAENPFFPLQGAHRVRNYAYVTVIHLFKGWNVDFIGFSHEYGFECIRELKKWTDPRFGVVLLTVALMVYAIRNCLPSYNAMGLLLFHMSWMITLFPISGIVKVGTFIADRIVVASTVSISILVGRFMLEWISVKKKDKVDSLGYTFTVHPLKSCVILALFSLMWYRVHHRSLDWMDSYPLLASSLKTCPRSAKSNLEISKVYSGLDRNHFNLTQSLHHLELAESIDPTYCDVHQQFYSVYIQQQRLLDFEKRLAQAIVCPFSMHGASEMWQRYWPVILQDDVTGDAKARMDRYQNKIQVAVQQEQAAVEEGLRPQWMGATLSFDVE